MEAVYFPEATFFWVMLLIAGVFLLFLFLIWLRNQLKNKYRRYK